MCGIAGVLKRKGTTLGLEIKPILQTMGNQIAYRGPDDEQILIDDPIGIIFRRLSIIDIDGGRQPMHNEDGSIVLMVNGEIYNHLDLRCKLKTKHVFKTRSDSEIILHLYEEYGLDFLQMLNGMFAIMLWDKNKKRLILARDRLGIKPLYYNINKERIIFGSEIKAILAYPDCPREYDWTSALSYRYYHASPEIQLHSFFKDIHYLPGGSALVYDYNKDKPRIETWWQVKPLSKEEYAEDSRNSKEIIEGYLEILKDSVRLRLMSDVEAGIFLSGGIDSVTIACLSSHYQKLHTFSHLNMSTFKNGDAKGAHITSREFGLPNHQVFHSPFDHERYTAEDWKRLLWLTETHLCYAEQLFKFQLHKYAKATRPELKVMLLGQGSDEFNGGYSTEIIKESQMEVTNNTTWLNLLFALKSSERRAIGNHSNACIAEHGNYIRREFLASFNKQHVYEHPWHYHIDRYRQSLQHYNLWHEDRTAAGNHIENRVPFLDHRLVEYCVKIPPSKYSTLFWKKQILYEAVKGAIPEYVRTKPKQPFFYGDHLHYVSRMMYKILTDDNNALISDAFGNGSHTVVDRKEIDIAVARIPKLPDGYEHDHVQHIFQLINMGLLEKTAKEVGYPVNPDTLGPELSSIKISDWETEEETLALKLMGQSNNFDMDRIISLAPHTFLMKTEKGFNKPDEVFIVTGDTIKTRLSEKTNKPWLSVLRKIDGRKTLRTIINEQNVSEAEIRVDLKNGIDNNIVYFKE
ncbi:MAG: asparagine synthase (glutamine-hydrolyzing) [Planctomycetes bacterium RIFCSPLOWO2_12_FULL_40_19]|nr:MAG: asparagine synthase (glutamine-hydrolyzing) [Planctomycetes bacterium RIFCSPLOWO2_12_FULL_40_19]